ncbi:MAG TPA: RIP metalloprotease RseP [Vicinamibacterales bacterium]|nr:RIP metalloprotease RseP [Vicinamibacterales bacterium]
MTTILSFVFVLGVLIFVHELGHFLMARRIGVRVLTFSLGFGPKLLTIKRGDTEYCISAIPLGGYVKMAGENPEDNRTGAPDEFLSKSKWQRFQVLVMGPVMNLGLAILVMALVIYQGAPTAAYETDPVVIGSFANSSVARDAGLEVGDRIVAVDGNPVPNWKDFSLEIAPKANRVVTLQVERNGKTFERRITPSALSKFEIGDIGIVPVLNPEVRQLSPNEAAELAGLRPGDVILGAAGESNIRYDRLVEIIKMHPDKPVVFDVRRANGTVEQVTVIPRTIGDTVRVGALFWGSEVRHADPTLPGAFKLSLIQNWEWTKLIMKTLKGLFTRETPMKQLMGPIGIAEMSGGAAQQGWLELFTLMAMISLNLGLLNLMPIPVLDGGHILILGLEGVSRRDFSLQVKEKMLMVGFVLLVTLMVTVIYNDLTRVEWLQNLNPWKA